MPPRSPHGSKGPAQEAPGRSSHTGPKPRQPGGTHVLQVAEDEVLERSVKDAPQTDHAPPPFLPQGSVKTLLTAVMGNSSTTGEGGGGQATFHTGPSGEYEHNREEENIYRNHGVHQTPSPRTEPRPGTGKADDRAGGGKQRGGSLPRRALARSSSLPKSTTDRPMLAEVSAGESPSAG